MSNWKKSIKSKTFRLALTVGLVIANLVTVAPAFATETTQASAQVLSKAPTNNINPTKSVFNKLDPKDVDVTVMTGTDLAEMRITNGKYVLTEKDYTLIDNKVTILSTYLDGLTTRSAKLKFDFAGGSDKSLTFALKNESATISAKSVSFTNKSTKDVSVTVKTNGLTLQGISYAGVDLPKDAYSEEIPSSSGSIKVLIKASYLATLADGTTKKLLFDYSGTGTNPSITLKVSGCKVVTVSSVRTETVITTQGVAPVLPKQVRAFYSDDLKGEGKLVEVTWDTIDPSEYADVGTFFVKGTIAETTAIEANAIVIVSAATDPTDPTDPAETAALALVVKAEDSKTQADKDVALVAVNALAPSATKTELLARVNAIVVAPADTEFEIIDVF